MAMVSTIRKVKNKFSLLSKLLIAILLVLVGMSAQFRFNVIGKWWSSSSQFSNQRSTSSYQPLDRMVNPDSIEMTQFWETWSYLQRDFLEPDKLQKAKMIEGATQGLARSLGDPYTMYLPPEDNKRSAEDLAGSFYGVGIELGFIDEILAVVAPLAGSPAEKAGVEAGDLILKVTDENRDFSQDTTNWTLQQAVDEIRGPRGSEVKLTLYRKNNGDQPFDVTIVRDEIVVKSVELSMISFQDKKFAHLKVNRFGERTSSEWESAVAEINSSQPPVDGILLDFRNNPGGFFDGAIELASDFIKTGVVVSQEGKDGKHDYQSRGLARLAKYPIVLLVNKGSASASEIVAGALRDQLGTKLIGGQTFGKGSVQDRRELSNGGGLHVTVARWVLPGGDWIQGDGLEPDVAIQDNRETEIDEVLLKAQEELFNQIKK